MNSSEDLVPIQRVVKILKFAWRILDPIGSDGKFTKLFIRFLIAHLSFAIVIPTYGFFGNKHLTLADLTELSAIFCQVSRHIIYLMIMTRLRQNFGALIDEMIEERMSVQKTDDNWTLTVGYAKKELMAVLVCFVGVCCLVGFFMIGVYFFKFNEYQLPYNFYIIFLPIDSFLSFNWILNCLFHELVMVSATVVFNTYTGLKLMVLNFSCWEIETLTLQAQKMFIRSENFGETDDEVRKTIEKSYRVMEFLSKARGLFRVSFLVDFSASSLIFCMCFYTLSSDMFGSSSIFVMIFMTFSQLSVYCWMGNRVNLCVEGLVAALYEVEWYSQSARHQKDLLMILIMAQRIKGFNGIFNSVDLETLLKILQFTYSLFALLQTRN